MKTCIMDGNEACANGAYLFTEVCGIYPITPSSPMASLIDKWSSSGRSNLFNEKVKVIQMQSEKGAAALTHGSLQAGSLSATFTSSQGLLLMIPSMYKIAGEMLPCVIHVSARSIATHALSIFGDHQDVYATRQTGFCILSSSSVQEAYYNSIIAHLSAIKGSLPFLHFFDGFRTSHELNKIDIFDDKELLDIIPYDKIDEFKQRALNLGKEITRGTAQNGDVYFQNTEVRNKYYDEMINIVEENMNIINEMSSSSIKPFNYYGDPNAEYVVIAMGSVCDTLREVVDIIGENVGMIEVHLYRPFSIKHLLDTIPSSTKKVAVLDRTKEPGSLGEPLYLDVVMALRDKDIKIIGGRYGLSSKNVSLNDINGVYYNLMNECKDNFTIGIDDDVTYYSIKPKEIDINPSYKEIKVWGFGSDGMVGASKNFIKVLGEKKYVQGYFEYDSKKSGGVTVSHLRVGPSKINAPYYLTNPDFIVVSKDVYLSRYNCLEGLKQGGILLINTNKDKEELNNLINNYNKNIIINNNIQVYICNLDELNHKYNLRGKINNIMCYYMFKLINESEDVLEEFKELVIKTYQDKGKETVDNNIDAINASSKYLNLISSSIFTVTKNEKISSDLMKSILYRKGDSLKVSDFLEHKDGTFEGGYASFDKRKINDIVPKWNKENCIACNQCSFVCPHAAIRAFSLDEQDLLHAHLDKAETIKSVGEEGKGFYVSINESNCTSCGLCIEACPGKNGKKALEKGKYNQRLDDISQRLFEEHENKTPFNKFTIKGLGFEKPLFEFSGACAGCGEAAYIKILTELFGKNIVISNATGCSSIYGGSLPLTPYKMPWINSLFEDNAEFGYGLHKSFNNIRNTIKNIMFNTRNDVSPELKNIYKEWIDNMEDDDITNGIKEVLLSHDIPLELEKLIDYIPSRKVWIIGGDGWAYDIGYDGIDHVLHSNENINILVLDTEVYSNTGGQKSKSTRKGAIAEFASSGKLENKKDLFKIAMSIPNVYVASVSMGANGMQTIKAFKEAYEHNGPSLIIAYSPCIEQGIKGGLSMSIEEQKLLVDVGYNILMRYNPNTGLKIDSKEPNFTEYHKVFEKELRYKNLSLNNEQAEEIYKENLNTAKNRYIYYKNLEESNNI